MKVIRYVLLILLVFVILELYLLIEVGSHIGPFLTLFLILATAVWGMFLIRRRGITSTMRAQKLFYDHQVPPLTIMKDHMLVVAGMLLIMPGFITDIIGVVCSTEPLRRWLMQRFLEVGFHKAHSNNTREYKHRILEGEYKQTDE